MSQPITQSQDTSLDAERVQFEVWRQMSAPQKLQVVGELCDSVRHLTEVGLRSRFPGATEHEIRMRLFATWLDRETMIRCYEWDPSEH